MRPETVGFFIFNRPAHTQRVFDAIAAARPRRLLVVADGPRAGHAGDAAACAAARKIAESVTWACDVRTHYASTNLGCKHRIASGLEWVFSQSDEAILLEDDTLPDPSFFPFCSELLARYRDDPRVFMIRGVSTLSRRAAIPTSYYFSRFYAIWGWASWARAFRHYDLTMRRWPELRGSAWLDRLLPTREMRRVMRNIFDRAHANAIDSWEFQWEYSGWLQNALAIAPATNLVTNIGFGADATHLKNPADAHASAPVTPVAFPLTHPREVEPFNDGDSEEWAAAFSCMPEKQALPIRTYKRLRAALARAARAIRRRNPGSVPQESMPDNLNASDRAVIEAVRPYTMTGPLRVAALLKAVRLCTERHIPGAFVECGVWRGGSVLAMIRQLQLLGITDRELFLFDTFEGMTEPTAADVSLSGELALDEWHRASRDGTRPWAHVFGEGSFDESTVRRLLESTAYPHERLHFVRGRVEATVPTHAPPTIALLRLDTDWYESTLHELEHLYPRLSPGGILILDDYGHWRGARRAVDEYFSRPEVGRATLQTIDYTGRLVIKAAGSRDG